MGFGDESGRYFAVTTFFLINVSRARIQHSFPNGQLTTVTQLTASLKNSPGFIHHPKVTGFHGCVNTIKKKHNKIGTDVYLL